MEWSVLFWPKNNIKPKPQTYIQIYNVIITAYILYSFDICLFCGFKNIFLIKKNLMTHIVLDICELWVMFEKIRSIWILFFYESKKKKLFGKKNFVREFFL